MLPLIKINSKPPLNEVIDLINEIGGYWAECPSNREAEQGVLENGESWVGIDYFPDDEDLPQPYFELGMYGPEPEPMAQKFAEAAIAKWGGTAQYLECQ